MKISELKETIRAKVRETLYAGPNALPAAIKDPSYNTLPPMEKTKVTNALKQKQSVNLEETNKFTADRINKMGRTELIDFLGLTREEARNWSDTQLFGAARELADDMEEPIDEIDYLDDDDDVREGVDDDNTDFKDYNSVYEVEKTDSFNANVAPGSVYQLSVEPHPTRPNLIILSQDNGQKVVIHVEDINSLINILKELD